MAPFIRKKPSKLQVEIKTFDSILFDIIDHRDTGQYLFDLVCRTLGLRETWYFGLQFENKKGHITWLKMNKKVKDQNLVLKDQYYVFHFYAKYFPENVAEELVQGISQHLFFLQVKQSILSMDIYCPPEASVLLASYAVHVQFGPYDPQIFKKGMLAEVSAELLPQRVIDQYQMTPQMWEDRIKTWYEDHEGMTRDEVEIEYLKIAQDLDMYGVNYFPITNKKNSELWLGVTAMGMNIYEKNNKLTPKTTFQWCETRDVSFSDKKFIIRPVDSKSPNFVFYSQNLHINKLILELCRGNHGLYMRRRKQDSMEVQQMKAQATEEKERRAFERMRLQRERQAREKAQMEKKAMEELLNKLQNDIRIANENLRLSEETKNLYFEKNRVNKEQMQLTEEKANKFEQEMTRLRNRHLQTETEKAELEKKIRENDFIVQQLAAEKERKDVEAAELREQLKILKFSHSEKEANLKLYNLFKTGTIAQSSMESVLSPPVSSSSITSGTYTFDPSDNLSDDYLSQDDMEQINNEIERSRIEYVEKTKQMHNKLRTLRSEIELLKNEDSQCHLDLICAEQLRAGETKYSTLKKLKSGSTKARVAFYEEL